MSGISIEYSVSPEEAIALARDLLAAVSKCEEVKAPSRNVIRIKKYLWQQVPTATFHEVEDPKIASPM